MPLKNGAELLEYIMSEGLRKEIITWCQKKERTRPEIMKKFKIPHEQRESLRLRLIENGINLRENRGRKKNEF